MSVDEEARLLKEKVDRLEEAATVVESGKVFAIIFTKYFLKWMAENDRAPDEDFILLLSDHNEANSEGLPDGFMEDYADSLSKHIYLRRFGNQN